ncbi:MAG: glutamine-hydrolyzing GMP synthase [Clostridia bacterium]|nr:glutamine-hydrolyzing GMP synthase [Clostridia bacterium]
MARSMIAIVDLGSNQNAFIARELRKLGVYSEIFNYDVSPAELKNAPGIQGIIVNGGPNHVLDGNNIDVDHGIYALGLPVLKAGYSGSEKADVEAWDEDPSKQLDAFITKTGAERNWSVESFIEAEVEALRKQIGSRKVLLALSGGVDSSVVAALLIKAVGDQLTCVHVNHGLLRKNEPEQVIRVFKEQLGANLIYVDAVDRFLNRLAGVSDPEQKRKIIGDEFIEVFREEAGKLDGIELLGQGTIYPDIVESGTKTAKIVKSHHNAGGLPKDIAEKFELVEPLKMLFKDEVRAVGRALGLPEGMVERQPFPGPGLGVRCLGAITRERLEKVRESDAILREEFEKAGLKGKVWQYFTLIPDVTSTGVRDDGRVDEYPVVIRAVNTVDAMTASVPRLPCEVLETITLRVTSEVPGVNRVLYDLSPKPVATIEWE